MLPLSATMTTVDWLGYFAAALTTSSFVPQVWLTLRTRDLSGVSLSMYATFTLGIAFWFAYGLVLARWPIIIANGLTLVLASTILAMKLAATKKSPGKTPGPSSIGRDAADQN